jgi:hypothetical protein
MIFAQFYHPSATDPSTLIEACGDRSVAIIDARLKSSTIGEIAAEECVKRGYKAWRIFKGETFTRSYPISQLHYVSDGKPVRDPAWLRAHD